MKLELIIAQLRRQYLIAYYLESKLEVVNYIKTEYDENKPVLINNRFLHMTAHVYYRSIIIDLYALLGPANDNNKNSFHRIIQNKPELLKPAALHEIANLLTKAIPDIAIIKDLRHTQMVHYDFDFKAVISLTLSQLPVVNRLFLLCKQIVEMFEASFIDNNHAASHVFGDHDYVESLKGLIARLQ